jgi:hypothetical protein
MNARLTTLALECAIIIAVAFMNGGCAKAPTDRINQALASTNVTFVPNLQPPIMLSPPQAEAVKRVVRRFNQPTEVRTETDILPHESGGFVLGGVRFGWLGRMLYIQDARRKRYYVVEDAVLARLSEAFFRAEGPQPPLKYPSQEEWQQILTALEEAHEGVKP